MTAQEKIDSSELQLFVDGLLDEAYDAIIRGLLEEKQLLRQFYMSNMSLGKFTALRSINMDMMTWLLKKRGLPRSIRRYRSRSRDLFSEVKDV